MSADQIMGEMRRFRVGPGPSARSPSRPVLVDVRRAWPGGAIAILIFVGHYLYAGIVSDSAMILVMGSALLLGAVLLAPSLRADLLDTTGLLWPGLFFTLAITVALVTLTPLVAGAVHPIWAASGATAGAITIDRSSTLIEILKLLGMACLFLAATAVGGSTRRSGHAVTAFLVLGVLLAAWALFGHVTRTLYATQTGRLEAHFMNPNTAGAFFAVLLVITLAKLSAMLRAVRPGSLPVALAGSAGLLFLVCLMMTLSRGAVVGAAAGVMFIAVARMTDGARARRRGLWIGLGVAVVALAALLLAGDHLVDRFLSADKDVAGRSAIWAAHFEAFRASPWWGYGLGTSATVNSMLIDQANYDTLWNIRAVLNVYLQWLEQAGVIGAAPMFLALAAVIGMSIQGWLRRGRERWLLTGFLAADMVFLVQGAADFALEAPSMAFMWTAILGLQFGVARRLARS